MPLVRILGGNMKERLKIPLVLISIAGILILTFFLGAWITSPPTHTYSGNLKEVSTQTSQETTVTLILNSATITFNLQSNQNLQTQLEIGHNYKIDIVERQTPQESHYELKSITEIP